MENNENIKQLTQDLLGQLAIQASIDVQNEDDQYNVHLDSEENALLIGKHGNTLSSLEYIIALMAAKSTGEYKRVVIEVGGYREDRESYLRELAERLKQDVIESGNEKRISGLKPWERRLIHMMFAEDSEVATESEGEDRDRVLVIKKK